MEKNAWIAYLCISMVLITLALVFMFILIPQINPDIFSVDVQYKGINKLDYTYSQIKDDSKIEQQYIVTEEDIKSGIKIKNYKPGKINPFATSDEVNIYGDTTSPNTNPVTGGTTRIPEQK